MLSTFASGPTHPTVIPFVDPNLIQSPFPFWTRAKSAPYLVEALTQRVNYCPSVAHRHTCVAGARKVPLTAIVFALPSRPMFRV
jgi:hypothetical protein